MFETGSDRGFVLLRGLGGLYIHVCVCVSVVIRFRV